MACTMLLSPVLCRPMTTAMFRVCTCSRASSAKCGTLALSNICRKKRWCEPQNCAHFTLELFSTFRPSEHRPDAAVLNTLCSICQNAQLRSYIALISSDNAQFSSSNSAPE